MQTHACIPLERYCPGVCAAAATGRGLLVYWGTCDYISDSYSSTTTLQRKLHCSCMPWYK